MRNPLRPWFPDHRGALTALLTSEALRNFGMTLAGVFVPIYILQRTGNIYFVPLYFLVVFTTTALSLFLVPPLLPRLGITRSIFLSNLFRLGNLGLLLAAASFPSLFWGAAVLEGLLVPTYWVPYHLIYTREGKVGYLGREVGTLGIIVQIAGALAPFLGGLVVTFFGFPALYALGMGVVFLSSFPLAFSRDEKHLEISKTSGREVWRGFWGPSWRPLFLGFGGYGVETAAGVILWPLFLFAVGAGSFTTLGAVSSAPALTGLLATALTASLIDRIGYRRALRWGVLFWAASWLVSGFLKSIPALFVLVLLDGIYGPLFRIPPEVATYTLAKREPLAFVLKRELTLHLFQMIGTGAVAVLWFFFPSNWPVLFAPAVLGSLLAVALTRAR